MSESIIDQWRPLLATTPQRGMPAASEWLIIEQRESDDDAQMTGQ